MSKSRSGSSSLGSVVAGAAPHGLAEGPVGSATKPGTDSRRRSESHGYRFLYRDEITWVVRQAGALARGGAPQGALVMTEGRTLGRGRFGRPLKVPAVGSLVLAVVLRPPLVDAPRLTLDALAAVAEAIEASVPVEVRMMWPNDLSVGGRRVGAVLVDAAGAGGTPPWAVVGVGINVNVEEGDLPEPLRATSGSLRMAYGRPVHRPELLARVLDGLQRGCISPSAAAGA